MSFNKSTIKDYITKTKDIEKYTYEAVKKEMEEALAPEIEKVVLNSLKEIESGLTSDETLNESIKLDVSPDANLNITVSSDGAQIEVGEETGSSESEINNTNTDTDMNTTDTPEDEIFEIEGLSEEGEIAAAPTADGEAETAETPVTEPNSMETLESKLEDLISKVDTIMAAVSPESAQGGEGEVQVVDDDGAQAGAAPAMDATAAPAPATPAAAPADNSVVSEDDVMFEIEDDMIENEFVTEDEISEVSLSELDGIDEIEIVDEDEDDSEDEEGVDEMKGIGNTVKRSAGNRQNFIKDKMQHSNAMNESIENIKAHYESKIDELKQENTSLSEAIQQYKSNIKEFESSFVELRKQVNEMQVFNGKLAYANKVLTSGGLTNDEKIRIAEAFDKAETIEEAKKLYNKIVAEMQTSNQSSSAIDKLQVAKPSVAQAPNQTAKTETIYESEEKRRNMRLAGLIKEEKEL